MDRRVERLNDTNAEQWEAFNRNSAEGTFFHSLKWKQIAERDPAYKPDYYLLFKDDAVSGIFPFVESSVRPFRGLIPSTNPHRLHGILDDYSDPDSIHYIITELKKINRHSNSISFLCLSTLHQQVTDNITQYPVFPFANDGHQVLDLSEFPPEEIWCSFSAKKGQRKFIRRFDENGYRVAEVHSRDDLQLFYQYYRENINFIGGTLRPFSHFTDIWDTLPSDEVRITLLINDSIVAGGLLSIPYKPRKTVYLTYLSLNRNLPNTYHPSYYLYWEAINWAWDNHYEKIFFGAQHLDKDNPRYRIKSEFCAKFQPIYSKMIPLTRIFSMGITLKRTMTGTPTAETGVLRD